MISRHAAWVWWLLVVSSVARAEAPPSVLAGSEPLDWTGDLSEQMVAGIDRFLMRKIAESVKEREKYWKRDFSSPEAYAKSVEPNRQRLRKIIGAVDPRVPFEGLEYVSTTARPSLVAESDQFTVHAVRWPVFPGVHGEGLLLQPKGEIKARIIAIPDADQTPEMLVGLSPGIEESSQFARQLASRGCQVVVPVLIDRKDTWSGNPTIRMTNQPHREWIYRMSYQMGRHIIGYEVQKVLAVVDWFCNANSVPARPVEEGAGGKEHSLPPRSVAEGEGPGAKGAGSKSRANSVPPKIGVAGYGEGALVAFYAAAIDTRIDAALVSGYFGPREQVWGQPIYRNVFGLLREFGDAEIATVIMPRYLMIEHAPMPSTSGPLDTAEGRRGAAPGKLEHCPHMTMRREFERVRESTMGLKERHPEYQTGASVSSAGLKGLVGPGDEGVLRKFLESMGIGPPGLNIRMGPEGLKISIGPSDRVAKKIAIRDSIDPLLCQQRQLTELVDYTQRLLHHSEDVRREFWKKADPSSVEKWEESCKWYRDYFWKEVIGKIEDEKLPPNPRSRKIHDHPKWTGYEVVLDVFPDVFAWGYLLVPKDLKPGEKRPVVVCQHGLEGLPEDCVTEDPKVRGYQYYKAFAAKLAERGFVTFAPHNPYRGGDKFRVLQRKANPLGLSLFSFITAQHEQILGWLGSLDFVDSKRIGFYGLSYGGKTAMRVPALLDGYCLSICSADFNDWIKKNVTVDARYSYMFTGEYEMPEFDLGNTFNYAEMAGLVAPRPFMVERGHYDGVAPDEWVAYEYAKVRRLYAQLKISERTRIEFFDGPHSIHGVETFEFLHQHLAWPGPPARP